MSRKEPTSEDAEAQFELGNNLCDKKDYKGAIGAYRKAIELRPDNAKAQFCLGRALCRNDQVHDAIVALLRAIEIKPDYAQAYLELGNILFVISEHRSELFDRAIDALRKDIDLTLDHRGGFLRDETVATLRKGYNLNPIDRVYSSFRGVLSISPEPEEALSSAPQGHSPWSRCRVDSRRACLCPFG